MRELGLQELQLRLSRAILSRRDYGDGIEMGGGEESFSIYRNNFFVSMERVLRGLYPGTAAVLGADFGKIARAYITAHPPSAPHLLSYGGDFSDFLAAEYPLTALLAAVERLCNLSYGSCYEESLSAAAFAELFASHGIEVRLRLHSACYVSAALPRTLCEAICGDAPINSVPAEAQSQISDSYVLVTRPDDVVVRSCLRKAEADFLEIIGSCGSLEEAIMDLSKKSDDAESSLAMLISAGAFSYLGAPSCGR